MNGNQPSYLNLHVPDSPGADGGRESASTRSRTQQEGTSNSDVVQLRVELRELTHRLHLAEMELAAIKRSVGYRVVCAARVVWNSRMGSARAFQRMGGAFGKAIRIFVDEGPRALTVRSMRKLARMIPARQIAPVEIPVAGAPRRDQAFQSLVSFAAMQHAGPGGSSRRSPVEVAHLLGQRCQPCSHFGSSCSLMKARGWQSRRKILAGTLSERSGACPIGAWPPRESESVSRLNLVYFVFPYRHPEQVWQWNVRQLLERIDVFNGRRIVTVATGPDSPDGRHRIDPPEAVIEAFSGYDVEFRFVANDPQRGEAPHFLPALREIASTNPSEAVFYAHAKGVTHKDQHSVRGWTEALYHHNLDRIDEVRDLLRRWPCLGIAKTYGYPDAFLVGKRERTWSENGRPWHAWHYAGSFWWVRHDALFTRPDWDQIEIYGYTTEKYLANFFRSEEAVCLAYDDLKNPHDPAVWQGFRDRRIA